MFIQVLVHGSSHLKWLFISKSTLKTDYDGPNGLKVPGLNQDLNHFYHYATVTFFI